MSHSVAYRFARIVIGLGAVLAQIALAFHYVLLPLLVVPGPAIYVLWLAWAAELAIVIWLAVRHTWLALIVPIVSLAAVTLVLGYGEPSLGWGA